jgi:hypothetical protein
MPDFRVLSILVLAAATAVASAGSPGLGPAAGHPLALPVELRENRFFLRPQTRDGKTLTLYSDSGGGHTMLSPAAVASLKLPTRSERLPDGEMVTTPSWPPWAPGAGIPAPAGTIGVRDVSEVGTGLDGFLGQDWFGGQTWTFDYPGRRLLWRASGELPAGTRTAFHVNRASDAPRFGRISISIDGEPLDVLFDTGATTRLTPAAIQAVGGGAASERATSFIKAAVFDRWRSRHPEWKVVPAAEVRTGADMIQVPQISVAGQTVGPVWFTRRPDAAFDQFMSSFMDAAVVGALGGSGLRYFRVTVDWAAGQAVFER